mmetsp:Transcript_52947/g.103557  ORF Transcript_52947/g.103557 Transcript_52947/m.103557 type:complete len:119 (+) Transcript_52947:234-590(+)
MFLLHPLRSWIQNATYADWVRCCACSFKTTRLHAARLLTDLHFKSTENTVNNVFGTRGHMHAEKTMGAWFQNNDMMKQRGLYKPKDSGTNYAKMLNFSKIKCPRCGAKTQWATALKQQ